MSLFERIHDDICAARDRINSIQIKRHHSVEISARVSYNNPDALTEGLALVVDITGTFEDLRQGEDGRVPSYTIERGWNSVSLGNHLVVPPHLWMTGPRTERWARNLDLFIYDAWMAVEEHEVAEAFLVDGERTLDPHDPDKRPVSKFARFEHLGGAR